MDVTFRSYLSQNWLNTNVYLTIPVNRLRLKAFIFVRKFRFGWHLRYDIEEGVCYIGTQVWSEKNIQLDFNCKPCMHQMSDSIMEDFLVFFKSFWCLGPNCWKIWNILLFNISLRTIKGRAKGTGDNHPAKDGVNSDTKKWDIHYLNTVLLKAFYNFETRDY